MLPTVLLLAAAEGLHLHQGAIRSVPTRASTLICSSTAPAADVTRRSTLIALLAVGATAAMKEAPRFGASEPSMVADTDDATYQLTAPALLDQNVPSLQVDKKVAVPGRKRPEPLLWWDEIPGSRDAVRMGSC